ncbi:MAG: spore coat polysaccharide biosynthesis predicted glycosyltransferase SpsG [Mariniblastus sp.]|jgi:spore coat polysaccharide biosynthesis predicted glycosyltransferase SpsG/L-amino acid N-acyltransferase YncA
MKLLIRVEAGPATGTHRVQRAISIGRSWQQRAWPNPSAQSPRDVVTLACGEIPRTLEKRIQQLGFNLVTTQHNDGDTLDALETASLAATMQADWIMTDGDCFDDNYHQALSHDTRKLLVVAEQIQNKNQHADLVYQPCVHTSRENNPASSTRVLCGPEFAIIDQAHESRKNGSESKRIASEAKRILVYIEGPDAHNWTLKTLQTLSDLRRKRMTVDCVVSKEYPHHAELEMFKKSANMTLRIHGNGDRISQIIPRADLAITNAGTFCYDIANQGLPAIVASTRRSQLRFTEALEQSGAIASLDELAETSEPQVEHEELRLDGAKLKSTILSLLNDRAWRKSMSDAGQKAVDSRGADRIVCSMIAATFTLRPATADDITTMWHWNNDPEVRSVSLRSRTARFDEFEQTTRRQLADSARQVWIAQDRQQQPIGLVGFEFISNSAESPAIPTALICVVVDQARRGKGLGTILTARACAKLFQANPECMVIARVKPSNVASEKAFRAAGFVGIPPAIVDDKMAIQFQLVAETITQSQPAPSQRLVNGQRQQYVA